MTVNGSKHLIDEDDAKLYDRQIRLWGADAQNRMRNASVLLITLRGVATEVAKNLVLAGIGALTLVDSELAVEDDLGANYFLRESDIGRERATAALTRIQALNPRVSVSTASLAEARSRLDNYDLVCLTDASIPLAIELNNDCRQRAKKFYFAHSLGLSGFIFADLVEHHYVVERSDPSDNEKPKILHKRHQTFVPLERALSNDFRAREKTLRPKALQRMLPFFEILGLIDALRLGDTTPTASTLQDRVDALLQKQGIDVSLIDPARLELLARVLPYEFAPSCAVLGGVLAQDILNALGGREAPIANFFVFDGETNSGEIAELNIERGS